MVYEGKGTNKRAQYKIKTLLIFIVERKELRLCRLNEMKNFDRRSKLHIIYYIGNIPAGNLQKTGNSNPFLSKAMSG